MIIYTDKLKIGDILNEDIFNNQGLHILAKHTAIRLEDILLLIKHRIEIVDIQAKEKFIPTAAENTPNIVNEKLQQTYDASLKEYQTFFLEALSSGQFDKAKTEWTLLELAGHLNQQKDVLALILTLQKEDENIYNHSLLVALLSYYIASWLGYAEKERLEITKAGYLHDIGKSRIPMSIRKNVALNENQKKEFQNHTVAGYEIILKSVSDETTALVALQHHEREDGTGYPFGLLKDKIHPYAQIVAVADTFISKTFNSIDMPKSSFSTVLQEMYELGFGKLNEKPVQALIHNLLPKMIGKKVLLSNGLIGEVILNNPVEMLKPLIKINEAQFIDLYKNQDVIIQNVLI